MAPMANCGLFLLGLGIMKQEASSRGWLADPNQRLPLPKWWKKSLSINAKILPCLPGRSGTGCWQSGCVTMTRCPASAPSTGEGGAGLGLACWRIPEGNNGACWTLLPSSSLKGTRLLSWGRGHYANAQATWVFWARSDWHHPGHYLSV